MPNKEEVLRFVNEIVSKSHYQNFNLKCLAKKNKLGLVLVSSDSQSAQELLNEIDKEGING